MAHRCGLPAQSSAASPSGPPSRLRCVIFRVSSAAEHTCAERSGSRAHAEVNNQPCGEGCHRHPGGAKGGGDSHRLLSMCAAVSWWRTRVLMDGHRDHKQVDLVVAMRLTTRLSQMKHFHTSLISEVRRGSGTSVFLFKQQLAGTVSP